MTLPSLRTPGRRRKIIEALRKGHGLHSAAAACGISYRRLAEWRQEDPEFRAEGDEARELTADVVEHELYRQAMEDHDTTATIFWLKAHRPEKFNRRQIVALEPMLVNGDADEVVHFYMPPNGRDQPLQNETAPMIEAVVEAEQPQSVETGPDGEEVELRIVGGTAVEAGHHQEHAALERHDDSDPEQREARPRTRIRI
jgi:hypothetical protein